MTYPAGDSASNGSWADVQGVRTPVFLPSAESIRYRRGVIARSSSAQGSIPGKLETNSPVMSSFRFDEIGYWSEIKLEIIKQYAQAYSKILVKHRLHHVY